MLSRALYRRRRGRRALTALAALALITGTVVLGSTVLAVNATGAFELEGNAVTEGGVPGDDDADRVCYQDAINDGLSAAAAQARCGTTSGTTGASAVTWVDAQAELTIFTGGGSKDPQNPGTDWLWKPKDTIPDKDTIEHAFAARYARTPSATNCPSAGTTCEVIYFGVDRFDNSGDAQLGFWFFKNKISLTNTASQGGFKFSGNHANGDLLLISQFSNGGTTATIEAHFWDSTCTKAANNNPQPGQCSAKNLKLQAKSTDAKCTTSASTAPFCGIVNPSDGTVAPWSFTDKSANHTYLQGEYYEAGVNLSSLGIGDACFPSMLAESRSSTSPTATLKDFVLASFQNCSATAQTTPSAASVSPGTPVTDTILITGAGTGTPPFPSSPANVVFSICGPIATGICDGSDTAHTAVAFGSSKALTPTATQGVSTATSDAVNTASSPLSPGRYCFVGSWAGDTNYPDGASDNSARECFTVVQIGTTTVTTPSDASGTALSGTQALGTLLYDSAVVTANSAGGGDVTGSVVFTVCTPAEVTSNGGTCSTGGTQVGSAVTVTPVAAANPPRSTALSSPGVAANVAGTWCFRAEFTSSSSAYAGSSDASVGECVQVGPENTTTVTTPSITSGAVNASVTDHAVVTATTNSDGTPTGTISFYICNPTQVATNGGTCSTGGSAAGSKTATAIAGSNPPASEATSDPITANVVGTWCFRAEYVPGGANGANYNGSSDSSTGECFLITDTTGATSVQNWLPNDSATITSVGGTALNGTLSFTLYDSADCTGTILYQEDTDAIEAGVQPFTLTGATSPVTRSTTNTTVLVTVDKTVSWKTVFTSSDPLVGSSSHCQSTALDITN